MIFLIGLLIVASILILILLMWLTFIIAADTDGCEDFDDDPFPIHQICITLFWFCFFILSGVYVIYKIIMGVI